MKSPIASLPIVMGPRMTSSKLTSPSGTANRRAAGSPAARRSRTAAGSSRAAATVVARRPARRVGLGAQRIEALLAAEAGVGEARGGEASAAAR